MALIFIVLPAIGTGLYAVVIKESYKLTGPDTIAYPWLLIGPEAIAYPVLAFNLITALYCLIPVLLLTGLILHRIIWPLLSRLVYPLANEDLLSNRTVLIAFGGACLAVALNIQHLGWQFFLDHIK